MTDLSKNYPDAHHDHYSKTIFGFWVYLLTDFVLFGSFFATYAVLCNNTYGGPSARDLFHLPFTLVQTLVLLTGSLTSGLGGVYAHRKNQRGVILWFSLTFLLGSLFLGMMLSEFSHLLQQHYSWKTSAFLSAFFTLVGTHGLHMVFALLWVLVLLIPVWRSGLTSVDVRRLTCLKMFWQFLNVVWIFIFSIVYLVGVA